MLQTGSGKTYTMGTGFKDGYQTGIIPLVMNVLFSKIETLKDQTEFQLHVSFIEVCRCLSSSSYIHQLHSVVPSSIYEPQHCSLKNLSSSVQTSVI